MSIKDIKRAYKRAKHFSTVKWDGPFLQWPQATKPPAILITNLAYLMEDLNCTGKLRMIDHVSSKINTYIDNNQVKGDKEIEEAMSSFCSQVFFDPGKL